MTSTIDLVDIDKALTSLLNKAKSGMSAALTSAAMKVRSDISRRAQTFKYPPGYMLLNTGYYARAWKTEKVVDGASPIDGYVRLYNQAPYAGVIEYGRRAGSMPPSSALVPWVRRKLGVSAKKAPGVAFAIAKKMKTKPIPGKYVLTAPVYQAHLQKLFVDEIKRTLKNVLTTGTP
jgi:hypothetical protein